MAQRHNNPALTDDPEPSIPTPTPTTDRKPPKPTKPDTNTTPLPTKKRTKPAKGASKPPATNKKRRVTSRQLLDAELDEAEEDFEHDLSEDGYIGEEEGREGKTQEPIRIKIELDITLKNAPGVFGMSAGGQVMRLSSMGGGGGDGRDGGYGLGGEDVKLMKKGRRNIKKEEPGDDISNKVIISPTEEADKGEDKGAINKMKKAAAIGIEKNDTAAVIDQTEEAVTEDGDQRAVTSEKEKVPTIKKVDKKVTVGQTKETTAAKKADKNAGTNQTSETVT